MVFFTFFFIFHLNCDISLWYLIFCAIDFDVITLRFSNHAGLYFVNRFLLCCHLSKDNVAFT